MLKIEKLDPSFFDYIALGDWHGTKQVGPKAWYSGTPELDRYVKGGEHDPGNVLAVTLPGRDAAPVVSKFRTARLGWHELAYNLVDYSSLGHLQGELNTLLSDRVGVDLLRLTLEGRLGLEGEQGFLRIKNTLEGRLLRLSLDNRVQLMPTDDEIEQLSRRAGDPMVSALAGRLIARLGVPQETEVARLALRELYVAVNQAGKGGRS